MGFALLQAFDPPSVLSLLPIAVSTTTPAAAAYGPTFLTPFMLLSRATNCFLMEIFSSLFFAMIFLLIIPLCCNFRFLLLCQMNCINELLAGVFNFHRILRSKIISTLTLMPSRKFSGFLYHIWSKFPLSAISKFARFFRAG